jgi:hypothetical protein
MVTFFDMYGFPYLRLLLLDGNIISFGNIQEHLYAHFLQLNHQ